MLNFPQIQNMFPCLFAKNVHMLIATFSGSTNAFNLTESLSEFANWTLQMPAGITRNRTDVHEWMIKVLNTCEEKYMDASTVAVLLQLWGLPGDDVPYELNSIAVDISYNFNRLNQQLWTPPAAAFEKAEQNSDDSSSESAASCGSSSSSLESSPIPDDC